MLTYEIQHEDESTVTVIITDDVTGMFSEKENINVAGLSDGDRMAAINALVEEYRQGGALSF
jgi:hypothetical protein